MKRALFKQADLTRAIKAAKKAGLRPVAAKIEPDGSIQISLSSKHNTSSNEWDDRL